MTSSTRMNRVSAGSTDLRCPCGNTQNWTSIQLDNGRIVATCGACGRQVTK